MMDSHHNTTYETGATLDLFEVKAQTQESIILRFFLRTNRAWSPSQVHCRTLPGHPLTSVRRAITNLERNGHLIKTDRKVQGVYGRPEHVWRAA